MSFNRENSCNDQTFQYELKFQQLITANKNSCSKRVTLSQDLNFKKEKKTDAVLFAFSYSNIVKYNKKTLLV